MKVSMLLLAAGRGARLGGGLPKAFRPLGGQALLLHAAQRLVEVADTRTGEGELLVVVHPDDRLTCLPAVAERLQQLGVAGIVDGGETRQQSVMAGLRASSDQAELVLVHDAARPLFPVAAARAALAAAERVGAALLALPVSDTVKQVDAEGLVVRTVDRADLWLAQTPQVVRRELLQRAMARAAAEGFVATDDAGLVEHLGEPVAVVPGSPYNLKITRPEDFELAEPLLGRLQTEDS